MDTSGSGKISSRHFAIGAKNKNLAGRSGIGVLGVGFSQIRALEKHAQLSLFYTQLHNEQMNGCKSQSRVTADLPREHLSNGIFGSV